MDVQKLPKTHLLHFAALCDLTESKKIRKKIREKKLEENFKKFGNFCQLFPHAGTVEENT